MVWVTVLEYCVYSYGDYISYFQNEGCVMILMILTVSHVSLTNIAFIGVIK